MIAGVLLSTSARAEFEPRIEPPGAPIVEPRPGPFWQSGGESRWWIETSISAGAWFSGLPLETGAQQVDVGGVASVGFRSTRAFRPHTPIQGLGEWSVAAMWLSVGLVALPVDAWLGNERGLDFRVRGSGSPDPAVAPWGLSVGLAPVFRISPNGSRLRFPSIVGGLLPEVGFAFTPVRTSLYVAWSPFPVGVVLVRHFALELNLEEGLSVPLDGALVRVFVGARVGVVVR